MSILIKNMVMPESCGECRLNNGVFCYAVPDYAVDDVMGRTDDRPPWCPLIELPPHGRLIDADALMGELQTTNEDENNGAKLLLDVFLEVLKSAPTIIESEGEE